MKWDIRCLETSIKNKIVFVKKNVISVAGLEKWSIGSIHRFYKQNISVSQYLNFKNILVK